MQVSRAGCFAITVGLSCVDVNETVTFRGAYPLWWPCSMRSLDVTRVLRIMPFLLLALYIGLFLFAYFLSDSMIFLPHPSSYQDSAEILQIIPTSGQKTFAAELHHPPPGLTL